MSLPTNNVQRSAFWHKHIQSCQLSTLSKARYCRENELNYQQFIYWSAKHCSALEADGVSSTQSSSKLIPVVLRESDSPIGIQIHLPNGVSISGICPRSVNLIRPLIEQL